MERLKKCLMNNPIRHIAGPYEDGVQQCKRCLKILADNRDKVIIEIYFSVGPESSAKEAADRNVVSYRLSPYGINLPSGLNLSREQVRTVAHALRASIESETTKSTRTAA